MWIALATAHAAEEPCYGHDWEDRLEGEHVWVEWDPDLLTEEAGGFLLGFVEDAWTLYEDEMGWDMPQPSVVVTVLESTAITGGVFGACRTHACDDGPQPKVEIYSAAYDAHAAASTATHELGHAVQYAYMTDTTTAVSAWSWWMEGCATWMEMRSDRDENWAYSVGAYLEKPHLALHHDALYLGDPDAGPHMYGTAMLAFYVEERFGVEGLRATWEYGRDHAAGEGLWFPDVVEGALGEPFDEFWARYLAEVAVQDVDVEGLNKLALPARQRNVGEYPAEGSSDPDPQNLGFDIVRFRGDRGTAGATLTVTLELDDTPDRWHVVLARADGAGERSNLLEYERIDGTTFTTSYEGSDELFLVVSPEVTGNTSITDGFSWSWTAEVTAPETEQRSCSCASGRIGSMLLVLPLLLTIRRRIR